MSTKSFTANAVNLFVGSLGDAQTGSVTVMMKTRKYYTDGTELKPGVAYTVTKAWGLSAVDKGWATNAAGDVLEQMGPNINGAALAALVSGAGISGASTQYLRWCIPGRDTSGTVFKDVSGRSNDATIEVSNGTPFAVDARMSTVAHASAGGIVVPLAATLCDFVADSGVMAVSMTNEDPAGSESVFSFGAGAGNQPGFYLSHRASAAGVGRIVGNRGNGSLVSGSDSTVKFSNAGGTRETHAIISWDGPTGSTYLYRDGVLAASNVGLMTGSNAFTLTVPLFGARLGSTGGTAATVAGIFRGWQGYVFTGRGLPLNLGAIAAMLAESPSTPIPNAAFVF